MKYNLRITFICKMRYFYLLSMIPDENSPQVKKNPELTTICQKKFILFSEQDRDFDWTDTQISDVCFQQSIEKTDDGFFLIVKIQIPKVFGSVVPINYGAMVCKPEYSIYLGKEFLDITTDGWSDKWTIKKSVLSEKEMFNF